MAKKAKHAFGSSSSVEAAKQENIIDSFDILFLDGDTDPKVGWIDKDGNTRIVSNQTDLSGIEAELAKKADTETVNATIDEKVAAATESAAASITEEVTATVDEKVAASTEAAVADIKSTLDSAKYVIAYKPEGTLVNYYSKEVRVMCPADTAWALQAVGAGGDSSRYYIGFKAYAPNSDVVSFKEDTKETIVDDTMYYFENNDFAGIESDGRKYSIVWLPVASHDVASDTWTYYGAMSSVEKYIGWYYSVEWYNAAGKVVSSDCVRINLANEDCYSSVEPYYIQEAVSKAVEDLAVGVEVVEF